LRKAINILRKFVHRVGSFTKNYTWMHSQQNIKFYNNICQRI